MRQLVHQLSLQNLEQHGARVVVQRCKRPQSVAHVLAVELRQALHSLSCHGAQDFPAAKSPLCIRVQASTMQPANAACRTQSKHQTLEHSSIDHAKCSLSNITYYGFVPRHKQYMMLSKMVVTCWHIVLRASSVQATRQQLHCCRTVRPARVEAKLGKGPDGIGNVLGVKLGDEVEAQVCRPLQEWLSWGVAYGGHRPQCVLDSLRREGMQLLKRHCRHCCQKLPSYMRSFQCVSLLGSLYTHERCMSFG